MLRWVYRTHNFMTLPCHFHYFQGLGRSLALPLALFLSPSHLWGRVTHSSLSPLQRRREKPLDLSSLRGRETWRTCLIPRSLESLKGMKNGEGLDGVKGWINFKTLSLTWGTVVSHEQQLVSCLQRPHLYLLILRTSVTVTFTQDPLYPSRQITHWIINLHSHG